MEDEKRLFYEKLDEYESKLPQKYDREKFVLSSEKCNIRVSPRTNSNSDLP
jgi:hypothetical protein